MRKSRFTETRWDLRPPSDGATPRLESGAGSRRAVPNRGRFGAGRQPCKSKRDAPGVSPKTLQP